MKHYTLNIPGELLQEAYSLYVIVIQHKEEGPFFYIGQTGNRAHKSARAIFRRLSGHFDDQGHSTQNQIYRSIAIKLFGDSLKAKKVFPDHIKQAVSNFLVKCQINVHSFPISEYQFDIKDEQHKYQRKQVENLEKALILALVDLPLLNLKIPKKHLTLLEEEQAIIQQVLDKIKP